MAGNMHIQRRLGIIGGSGLYQLEGLEESRKVAVQTPFGKPSDELVLGTLAGLPIAFLPRHGRGHRLLPTDINARANLFALKAVGCTDVLSLSAAGSLKEELSPGTFVVVDQFIDRTFARSKSFFSGTLTAHVSMAKPVCSILGERVSGTLRELDIKHRRGGTYVVMEGPQFSTLAESELYRSWGGDIIGMTAMPEAKLAREAELCYALVAMITDYDCWRDASEAVSAAAVAQLMSTLGQQARALVKAVAAKLPKTFVSCPHACDRALNGAVMTAHDCIDSQTRSALAPLLTRVLAAPVQ